MATMNARSSSATPLTFKKVEHDVEPVEGEIFTTRSEIENKESTNGIKESMEFGGRKKNKSQHSKTEKRKLVGHKTSKYTDLRTRNRKCLKTLSKGKSVMALECRKNHQGSSKSMMEPLVEFKPFFHTEKYSLVIGDDASVLSRIKKNVDTNIDKWSDVNQALWAFKKHLYDVRGKSFGLWSDRMTENVIEHFSKCFSYCLSKHKNNPSVLKAELQVIVPHLFGDHSKCEGWCKFESSGHSYKHTHLSSDRHLKGENLRKFLNDVILPFSTDKAVDKLATLGSSSIKNNSKRKSRFYGGSRSRDFRTAVPVAQFNEGHIYLHKRKQKRGADNQIDRMNRKRQLACKSKSGPAAKIGRKASKSKHDSKTKRKEKRKGTTSCSRTGFPILVTQEEFAQLSLDQSGYKQVKAFLDKNQLIHRLVKPSIPPTCRNERFHKLIVFDIETSGLSMDAEILQLSCVVLNSRQTFNSYIMPKWRISSSSSKVHNLHIRYENGQRMLCKNKVPVHAKPLSTVLKKFVDFLENTAEGQPLLLIGHNANVFDTPRIVNELVSVQPLMKRLHKLQIYFGDSLPVFKTQLNRKSTMKLSDLYNEATGETFDAHDALEDVLALKKLLLHYGESFINNIAQASKTLTYFVQLHQYKMTKAISSNSYQEKSIKKSLKNRLIQNGLPFPSLKSAYQNCGSNALISYLTYKNGLKTRIAKDVDDVNQILNML
ncbi:uncharacterized protein LOC116294049 [Actinia tenebrosa]|uniref:Uncharacterized protein LOC116294049 n=1 Tax=Actinia tenebrosa TaxID=6105 RepID=A0A6P8HP37_ACTTE|nr:uncharacterized protein LOC116294049 [Actinia tenebrosa]